MKVDLPEIKPKIKINAMMKTKINRMIKPKIKINKMIKPKIKMVNLPDSPVPRRRIL